MPRSAADATRFTATGPYASSKPPPSSISLGGRAPQNETPQQKIKRLRAAAAAAKLGQESQFDKVVRVGRVWADRAHRTTAWGLIGLTVICGTFATFSIGDMLIHNRRKRREWLEEQQRKTAVALEEARTAAARGIANDNQVLLLNRERASQEAEAARQARKGIFGRTKDAIFGTTVEQEAKGGKILTELRASQQQAKIAGPNTTIPEGGILEDVNSGIKSTVAKVEEKVLHNVEPTLGGPLDQRAQALVDGVSSSSKRWLSWMPGR